MAEGLFPPPFIHPMVDERGVVTSPWGLWADGIYRGDAGTEWTPVFVGLTTTGDPTITGVYYRVSARLFYFRVTITPAVDTTAVNGTTYINNLPVQMIADTVCFGVIPPVSAMGACSASANRIYVPSWSSITVPVTVTGFVEAQ